MRVRSSLLLILATVGAAACADPPTTAGSRDPMAGRTYILKVPLGYDGSRALPLVLAIHGYGASGASIEEYFGLDPVADAQSFFVAYPDGTVDASGRRFFNATDACCDFYGTGVDDVAYFGALIDSIAATYAIDQARVYAVGHSNGGFMSHRLACDLSPRIAAVVSLEGATWSDPSRCRPTEPVAVAEVHGTDDVTISPGGGNVVDEYPGRVYPSLPQTMATWAGLERCGATTVGGADPGVIDSETSAATTVTQWGGCKGDVELWSIEGGTHVPALTAAWPDALHTFLAAHSKSRPVSAANAGHTR